MLHFVAQSSPVDRPSVSTPEPDAANRKRRFLFLQGTPTLFFRQLSRALKARGHAVRRINFTAGDRLYGDWTGADSFRGPLEFWPDFLDARLATWGITDIILFGDWRPLHQVAIELAARRRLPVHVFEEGYLRPDWITLELGGVNRNSSLPRDRDSLIEPARTAPAWQEPQRINSSFAHRAAYDVVYHSWSALFAWRYPGYRSHLPLNPFLEYAGWIRRFARTIPRRIRTDHLLTCIYSSEWPVFLFPLQLDDDSQVRLNSPFDGLATAIKFVLESFSRFAPADARLVVKEHPLDAQLTDWEKLIAGAATELGISSRVIYLRGGDIQQLTQRSSGVVTINSTAGIFALSGGIPTIALGDAIYRMDGLTFQGSLDGFWQNRTPPDPALFDAFRRVVAHHTQINGGFFSRQGIKLAVAGAVARLETCAGQNSANHHACPRTLLPA